MAHCVRPPNVRADEALAKGWVQADPDAAIAWYRGRPIPDASPGSSPELDATVELLTALTIEQLRTAVDWVRSRPRAPDQRDRLVSELLNQGRVPIRAVEQLLRFFPARKSGLPLCKNEPCN